MVFFESSNVMFFQTNGISSVYRAESASLLGGRFGRAKRPII